MSLGWMVMLETPAGQGRVVVQQFLAHYKDPKIAEAEVRKFISSPANIRVKAQRPITHGQMIARNIARGEIQPVPFDM
jgi:hypothetical protein